MRALLIAAAFLASAALSTAQQQHYSWYHVEFVDVDCTTIFLPCDDGWDCIEPTGDPLDPLLFKCIDGSWVDVTPIRDHTDLASLAWDASGHTGTALNLASFTAGGAAGFVSTSAGLLAALSDETGTGAAVFGTEPTITPTLIISDSAADAPVRVTERSTAPSSPTTEDLYVDDGTNTSSGLPGWKRYTGSAWEDLSAGATSTYSMITGFSVSANTTWQAIAGYVVAWDGHTENVRFCFDWTSTQVGNTAHIRVSNFNGGTPLAIVETTKASSFTQTFYCIDNAEDSGANFPSSPELVFVEVKYSAGTGTIGMGYNATWAVR